MTRSVLATILGLMIAGIAGAWAAESGDGVPGPEEFQPRPSSAWRVGGFGDFGYLRDFNHPSNRLFRSRGTTQNVDDWHLNMAGAYVRKSPSEQSRLGAEITVQGGRDSRLFGLSPTASNIGGYRWMRHLGPANLSCLADVGSGLTLQTGIFPSLIGYDSLYAKDNFTYTRPWGADFTPYLMMGVNASYPWSEKLTGTFYVVHGYWHLASANSVPSIGGQLAYRRNPRVTLKETILWGPHQERTSLALWRFLSDTILDRRGDRAVVAFEYQVATEGVDAPGSPRAWWMAAQLPVHWTLHGPWSVTLRPEFAWDSDGRWTLFEQTVKAMTTTLEYRTRIRQAGTILRLEHRYDDSRGRDGGFFKDGEVQPGVVGLTPTQHLLILGVIFTFEGKGIVP